MKRKIKVKYYDSKDKQSAKKMEKVLNWYANQSEFEKTTAQKVYEICASTIIEAGISKIIK